MQTVPTRIMLTVFLLACAAGCGLFGPPSWVQSYPNDQDYVYGVGSAGLTFDGSTTRSEDLAKQRALDSLAKQIRVRVMSATILRDEQSWSHYQEDIFQFTDEDLRGVEIVEIWVDDYGWAGKAEHTYVLIRMPRRKAESIAARTR